MYRPVVIVGIFVVVVAFLSALPRPSLADGPPTVTGWMEQFTFIDPPPPAPQTAFLVGDGREVTLGDFRGNILLVNFWATWCAPCVRELPSLDRLQADLGAEGLLVLALNQDRGGAAVAGPFLEKLGITRLPLFTDRHMKLGRALGVRALPWSLIVNRAGNVVGMLPGYAEWDSDEGIALIRHYLRQADSPPVLEKSGYGRRPPGGFKSARQHRAVSRADQIFDVFVAPVKRQ